MPTEVNHVKEYLLTTDEFRNPKVLEGAKAIGILLVRLLLMEPGTNPLHPDMGVGIGPRYRFITDSDLEQLYTRVKDQINTYLPSLFFSSAQVNLDIKSNKMLVITIVADGTSYVYDTEETDNPIELSDLL